MENYESATQAVLEGIREVYDKYVIFPSDAARDVATLWVAHSWCTDHFQTTPRIFFNANREASGKTRAATVTASMGPTMTETINLVPSMIYSLIREEDEGPTLYLDETDKIWGKYGTKQNKQQLVQILNVGFYRDKETVIGRSGSYTRSAVSCPVVFSGQGDSLPRDLMTRSIKITMERVKSDQVDQLVEYTVDNYSRDFARVHEAMRIWVRDFAQYLDLIFPETNSVLRDKEVWNPLLSVACLAGDEWEARAVNAIRVVQNGGQLPLSDKLVLDIETIVHKLPEDQAFVFTENLRDSLMSLFGWGEKFVSPKVISNILRPHGVEPTHGSVDNVKGRGYRVEDIKRAARRLRESS